MYESNDYHKLKMQLIHFQTVQRYVDLARTFRSMAYAENLKLISSGDRFGRRDHDHEISLSDSLRGDCLEHLATLCEQTAEKIASHSPEPFEVKEACRV